MDEMCQDLGMPGIGANRHKQSLNLGLRLF